MPSDGGAHLEIRPVRSARDVEAFITAAYTAQGQDRHWVPSLDFEFHKFFNHRHSVFLQENEVEAFVAFRDGLAVGRVVAILNRAYLQRYKDRTGHFGFLEGVDDRHVFAALDRAVGQWLSARGMTRLLGPFSASVNHESGLLIDGFDAPHVVRTNYAPPFYTTHLAALGFSKAMDLFAYRLDPANMTKLDLGRVLAKRVGGRLQTSGLLPALWRNGIGCLLDIYNETWAGNWGSVPLTRAELAFIARLTLPVLKPSWIRVAEWDRQPIALVIQIPDANEPLAFLRGKLLPFGWARLLAHVHVLGTRRARIAVAGVVPKWQGTRLGWVALALLVSEVVEAARQAGVAEIEASWIAESNLRASPVKNSQAIEGAG
jgi:hypothetical protein